MLATLVTTSNNMIFMNMENQTIKVSHLQVLKLLVVNFQKIQSTLKIEGVLVQMTFTKAFESKQEVVNAIKQFHFMCSFNFDVVENKSDKYVFMCSQYDNGCYWRTRVSFSKIRKRWELKKLNDFHTCTNSFISQDHVRLDSSVIAHNIIHLVKTNLSIKIKTLIADMH